ncbi:MAG TPA: pilus assembly PilX N-terminal domain-containing protein, partial [Candidatus Binatia bacterium]|nr:pilus assembly PilX N-terminal domain-containing protein [Candidatus Binatia bacterium]
MPISGGRRGGLDSRGIAVAMALIALLVLAPLMIALAALSGSDPVIADNQHRGAAARALAESGVEWVVWALGVRHGGLDAAELAPAAVAAAPHDGSTFVALGDDGGFTVKVTGVSENEVEVESVGWTSPDRDRGRAHRRVTARLMRLPDLGRHAPCAVCVRGDLDVRDSAVVSAAGDTSCGPKPGAAATGRTTVAGQGRVYGADGNDWPNQPSDLTTVPRLAAVTLDADAFAVLKALARSHGAYYGPGSPPPAQTTWTGRVRFDATNPLPADGVVFVDTASGRPPTDGDPGDLAMVEFHGAPFPRGQFHGWIVVMGSVTAFDATGTLNGLLYAVDDVALTGRAEVNGLVVGANLQEGGSPAGSIVGGLATVTFDCAQARGAGRVPRGWFLKPGSYREAS